MTQLSSFQPLPPISLPRPVRRSNRHYAADALLLPCAKGNRPTTSSPSSFLVSRTRSLPRGPSDAIASPPPVNYADSRGIPTIRLFLLPSSNPCPTPVDGAHRGDFYGGAAWRERRALCRFAEERRTCKGSAKIPRKKNIYLFFLSLSVALTA
ncbi:hypothetical protein X777_14997 [Ooceraea biroi]|uniref:Uncharacterized protein n=1 Tax=Ooceraea biroi TaxID=2015173 RepID=A0A026WS88_OOCBI|nr:hypothetical protein X777_14997 [Ooceraea biroi]